jgi:glycosyltransferase involved in cell wall biosynthesis
LKTAELLGMHGHEALFFSVNHPETLPCDTDNFLPYLDFNSDRSMTLNLKIAGRILYSVDARRRLSHTLAGQHVDIAHLHNIYHHISPSILDELKVRGIPSVMILHDYKMVCPSHALLHKGRICEDCSGGKYYNAIKNRCVKDSLMKSLLAFCEMFLHQRILDIYDKVDIFVSPSIFLMNKLKEMGFKKDILLLRNFIDVGAVSAKKRMGTKREKKKSEFIYFGRLSGEKGLWTLLEASKLLIKKGYGGSIKIKIVGTGSVENVLRGKAHDDKIDIVEFHGYLSGETLFHEVSRSIASILPSECYENNPVSVLESFSLGVPVIGSKLGGIPELVKHNETGLTFTAGKAEELADRIVYMFENQDIAGNMGRTAKEMVEREMNSEVYYKNLMKIYGKLVKSG